MVTTQQEHCKIPAPDTSLEDLLRQDGFQLVPTFARPLDGRVVGKICDRATGQLRDMTDYEIVGLFMGCGEAFARRIRRTFYCRSPEGVRLRINTFWRNASHWGLQYATPCATCRVEVWTNADVPALPECWACRHAGLPETPTCPETGFACSTSYKRRVDPCRCEACRTWNREQHRRLRAARAARCNPTLVLQGTTTSKGSPGSLRPEELRRGYTATGPAGWTWLPASVRQTLVRYEQCLEQEDAHDAGAEQSATLDRQRQTEAGRRAGADGSQRRPQVRPRPMPRAKGNLQIGLQVLLARGPIAADGTIWVDLPGGPVKVVAA